MHLEIVTIPSPFLQISLYGRLEYNFAIETAMLAVNCVPNLLTDAYSKMYNFGLPVFKNRLVYITYQNPFFMQELVFFAANGLHSNSEKVPGPALPKKWPLKQMQ
jgi:hypothetical protein